MEPKTLESASELKKSSPTATETQPTPPSDPTVPPIPPCDPSAPSTESTVYPLRLRGVLTVLNDQQDCEFRAQRSTGVSSQKEVSSTKDSKLYKTTGEKKPKMVAHITVPADSADPAADMQKQLQQLTKGMKTKAKPKLNGRVLLDEKDCRVVLNEKERRVQVIFDIDLTASYDHQNQLIRKMQKISTCFAINQPYLSQPKS